MFQNAKKAPLFKLYKKKYFPRIAEAEKSRQVITFQGLLRFVKDLLSEDFSPDFLPKDPDLKLTIQYLVIPGPNSGRFNLPVTCWSFHLKQFVDNHEFNKGKETQESKFLSLEIPKFSTKL